MRAPSAPTPRRTLGAARAAAGRGITAVAAGQLGRVRVARGPLLFVATVQSLGLVILLRGVVHHHDVATAAADRRRLDRPGRRVRRAEPAGAAVRAP